MRLHRPQFTALCGDYRDCVHAMDAQAEGLGEGVAQLALVDF
jgi:hypothetical protein